MTPMERRGFWTNRITQLVNESAENHLHDLDGRAWGEPLIGIAAGDDLLFMTYKQVIGDVHWTPAEAMSIAYPDVAFDPRNLRVICWILPQTIETVLEQRQQDKLPGKKSVVSKTDPSCIL
ncbi:MAG: hypothetical protein K0A94_02635 [Desulfuromonadales bacterium]|nr:hypothetical protein [Desulfuromonadales bacterium]